ncbi:hypothetical protein BO94DRAFT_573403 [Aspergillus sclerotioniger CBS 115572]|uniref:Uncharacterized protein n=1 Tax=Aspergillus sclerotioniger CBS 115572 TaxID=1450535 RepID=A0A317X3R0_9EURO|nr:hypothetical protein BO94DRAFT_573403 [Aspergillus sclerotioniger CBS 115572]PWY93249.1 hypothetical protein BO94DRAFT_573403 [Aspergillus sclerotioniger CBS 115572]
MAAINREEARNRIEAAVLQTYEDQNPRTDNQEQEAAQNQPFVRPHLSAADKAVAMVLEAVRLIEWWEENGVPMMRKIKSREATSASVLYHRGVEVPPCTRCERLGPFARCIIAPVYREKSIHRAACSNCIFYHHGTYCSHREKFQVTTKKDWNAEDTEHVLAAGGLRAALQAAGQTGVEFLSAQPADAQPADAQPADAQPEDAQPEDAQPEDAQPAIAQPTDEQPAMPQPAVAQPMMAQSKKARTNKPELNKTDPDNDQPEKTQHEEYEAEARRYMLPEGFEMDLANFNEFGEYTQEQVDPDFGWTPQPQASRKEIQANHMPSPPGAPEPIQQYQMPTMQSDPFSLCAYPVNDDYWLFRLTPETLCEDQEPGHRPGRERWHPYRGHRGA